MISPDDTQALWLTLKLAGVSCVVLVFLCTPIAWWLAFSKSRWRSLVEAVSSLPLVLPPTVLGFYLLIALGPDGIGGWFNFIGMRTLAFSFSGLVIGSVIYSLPFVIQPLKHGFVSMGKQPLENAAVLGASPTQTFLRIVLPLTRPAYLVALILAFAHTIGEFGVVLMIGGSISGETEVLSIAIYNHVESLNYASAHVLAGLLVVFSIITLVSVHQLGRALPSWRGYR